MNRVVVTGIGVACALGHGKEAVWSSLISNRREFARPDLFDPGEGRSPVAQATGINRGRARRSEGSRLDRMIRIAADEALHESRAGEDRLSRFGVFLGNSNGGMLEAEEWYARQLRPPAHTSAAGVLLLPGSASTDRLARELGARGPRLTVTTACSSSAAAIALAAERIRDGEVEAMVAGGGDPLCRLTYAGFGALRLLDPEGCRPFDPGRRGLTLGEGAALLVLEERAHALERGATVLGEILGHGASCDAWHMTGCHPEGRGMKAAMVEALRSASVEPGRIDYVNAHGTATPANDQAEGLAIAAVFAERDGAATAAVSSTKSMHGHMLGGSGAVEAAITLMALGRGVLPATVGTSPAGEGPAIDLVTGEPRRVAARRAISNSFGFGGGNIVLVLSRPDGDGERP